MGIQPQSNNIETTYFYFDNILQPPLSPTIIMKVKSFFKKIVDRIFDTETEAPPRRSLSVALRRDNIVWPYQRRILNRVTPASQILFKTPIPRLVVSPPTPTAEQVLAGFTLDKVVVEVYDGVQYGYYPDDKSRGGMIPQRPNPSLRHGDRW